MIFMDKMYGVFVGGLFTALGLCMLYRPFAEGLIKFKNSLNGVQTKFTDTTIQGTKIGGIIITVVGILILIVVLFGKQSY